MAIFSLGKHRPVRCSSVERGLGDYTLGKEVSRVEEKGQGLVEYALILVLIALVVIGVVSLLGPAVADAFQQIVNAFTGL